MQTALCALVMLSFNLTLKAADPFLGTWKLNVAESTLHGRNADIASETVTMSDKGPTAYRIIVDSVSKSGEVRHQEFKRNYDGREHRVRRGETEIDLRVDASTHKVIRKKDGKVTDEFTATISRDGEAMTERLTNGEIQIFERQ